MSSEGFLVKMGLLGNESGSTLDALKDLGHKDAEAEHFHDVNTEDETTPNT